ncbi:MAG: GNAT family N-acetyltransferase [Anaerolineae bacterium]|nr:MAG: GNAT family N-acetyltransferase [Anaerolineae bacterium]
MPEGYDAFTYRIRAGWVNPDYSYVIWDGAEVAGAVLNDMGPAAVHHLGRNQGWIGLLYVRRPWRQRGLARALLTHSLQQARALGHALAGLRVDAENLTGAVRLYETLGFTVQKTSVIYHRAYPAAA